VSTNDDGDTDDPGSGNGTVPKLTMGQRVLASLPNLQRPPKPPPGPAPARGATTNAGRGTNGKGVAVPDEVLEPGDGPAPRGRLRGALTQPPGPRKARGAPSGMSKEELTHVIKRIDDREQLLAYSSAVLGVVVGIGLTIALVHLNPPLHKKNHESTGYLELVGVVRVAVAGVVALAAWKRRRSFVAFALLILGTSMTPDALFAFPSGLSAIWMIFRVLKWQKELAALTAEARPARPGAGRPGRDAAEARRRARAERLRRARPGGRRAKKQPEPTGPPQNKRYTPPGQARPRPPNRDRRLIPGNESGVRRRDHREASSTRRAERSRLRISWRRRTRERAEGSSPRARKTSTSVTIPITVE
jgi:hypothetical protein